MTFTTYDQWKLDSPEEPEPITTDWKGEEVYEWELEDFFVDPNGELVHLDDARDYIKESFEKA